MKVCRAQLAPSCLLKKARQFFKNRGATAQGLRPLERRWPWPKSSSTGLGEPTSIDSRELAGTTCIAFARAEITDKRPAHWRYTWRVTQDRRTHAPEHNTCCFVTRYICRRRRHGEGTTAPSLARSLSLSRAPSCPSSFLSPRYALPSNHDFGLHVQQQPQRCWWK